MTVLVTILPRRANGEGVALTVVAEAKAHANARLLERFQASRSDADFQELYVALRPLVLHLAKDHRSDPIEIDELVQTTETRDTHRS